jgi:hypothetical protein
MRLRRRIAAEHGGARHVALLQAHAQAVLEVDGGKQDHAGLAWSANGPLNNPEADIPTVVIPGRPEGLDPESRRNHKPPDSGFAGFARAPE